MPASVVTLHHNDFDVDDLVDRKDGRAVTACLPARNEAATIGPIVATLRDRLMVDRPLLDEILVIDDHSTDDTAAIAADAGARVVAATDVEPGSDLGPGKGQALWKSVLVADGDVIVWCDADIRSFGARFVVGILGPLLGDGGHVFAKGCYERTLDGRLGEGGRTTELVARPLVALLRPDLASFAQPLAGEYGGHRDVLADLPFTEGYGVDLALLADVVERHGIDRVAQVDLGTRSHRNRPLHELGPQAVSVMAALLAKEGLPIAEDVKLERPQRAPAAVSTRTLPPPATVEVSVHQAG